MTVKKQSYIFNVTLDVCQIEPSDLKYKYILFFGVMNTEQKPLLVNTLKENKKKV